MAENETSTRVPAILPTWMRRRWGAIAAGAAVLAASLGFLTDIQGLIFGSSLSRAEAEMLASRVAIRMESGMRNNDGDALSQALESLARDGGRREQAALEQLDAGQGDEALQSLEAATDQLVRRNPELAARRYAELGVIAENIDTGRAIAFYQSALDLDPDNLRALNRLGSVLFNTGAPDRARALYAHALDLARERDDTQAEITALAGLASLEANAGNLAAADVRYTEALELADSTGALRSSANMLGNRGFVAEARGDGETALAFYGRALTLLEQAGDPVGAALARNNLANFQRQSGELDAAADNYRLALAALEQADRRALGALVLQNLGATAEARGDRDAAGRFYQRALERAREFDYAGYIASSARRAGWLALGRGEPAEAISLGEEALAATEQLADEAGEADARVLLTGAYAAADSHEAARLQTQRIFAIFETLDPPRETVGYLQSALGLMAFRDGNMEAARTHSQLARNAYDSAGMLAETAEQDRRLATLARDAGDGDAACTHLADALDAYLAINDAAMRDSVRARLTELNCPQRG